MKQSVLYLDDLQIGDSFMSDTYELGSEEIKNFARKYDPQDFHIDERLAQDSFFEGLAGSGWQTASITMKLIVESVPLAHGIIGANADLRWLLPTRPGDILRVKSTITNIKRSKSNPNRAIVSFTCETLNQRDEVCQEMHTKVLSFKKES